jgi:hypothetical protein
MSLGEYLLLLKVTVPTNWFADGQHILALLGGFIAVGVQGYNLWKMYLTAKKVDVVELKTVTNADALVIVSAKAAAAQSAVDDLKQEIERLVIAQNGDRRASKDAPLGGSPDPVIVAQRNAAQGQLNRRFSDQKPPPPEPKSGWPIS